MVNWSRLRALRRIVPSRLRREFATRGRDARFLIWVSFLLAFLWARTWVTVIGKHAPVLTFEGQFEIGHRIVIFGYHPHHIATGVFLLAVAGWMGIFFAGKQIRRVAGVLYGIGLGLVVDEIGFIVEGINPYQDDWAEVFVLVVVLGSLLLSAIYFPGFWRGLEGRLKWALGRKWRKSHEAPAAPLPTVPGEATPEVAPPPTPAPAEPEPGPRP